MSKPMKRETRLLLQRLLTVASLAVAIAATVLWFRYRANDIAVPLGLKGVLGYAWTFVAFYGINLWARAYARRKRPVYFERREKQTRKKQA